LNSNPDENLEIHIRIILPSSYIEVINFYNKNYRINAIKEELNNLYSIKFMTFVSKVPPGKNIIYTKSFFDTKSDSNNFIYKYKSPSCCQRFPSKMGYKL